MPGGRPVSTGYTPPYPVYPGANPPYPSMPGTGSYPQGPAYPPPVTAGAGYPPYYPNQTEGSSGYPPYPTGTAQPPATNFTPYPPSGYPPTSSVSGLSLIFCTRKLFIG
jgi:hypothetical protein